MDIEKHWPEIRSVFASSKMCTVATVSPEGVPNIAPVGSVHLNEDLTGLFFDLYTVRTSENIEAGSKVCIMACDMRPTTWLSAMLSGSYKTPPGVRIIGVAGDKRQATKKEREKFLNRVRIFRGFKGYDLVWKNFGQVRDLKFHTFEPVMFGPITQGLWRK